MSGRLLVTAFGDAALAARFVQRRCGPDAPLVLAVLGLDTPVTPPAAPRRSPGSRVAPDPYRRTTKGKGRRRR